MVQHIDILAVPIRDDQTVLAINITHLLEQLTPQLLNGSRDLLRHAGVSTVVQPDSRAGMGLYPRGKIRCLSMVSEEFKSGLKSNTGWRIFT